MSHPLFVYGTLMRGGERAGLAGRGRRGAAWIHGTLYDLPAGYPAITLGGEGRVHGEWCDPVSDTQLRLLDLYEGVDEGLYRRVLTDVHTRTATFRAWVWVMEDPLAHGGRAIPSGRWRAVRRPPARDLR